MGITWRVKVIRDDVLFGETDILGLGIPRKHYYKAGRAGIARGSKSSLSCFSVTVLGSNEGLPSKLLVMTTELCELLSLLGLCFLLKFLRSLLVISG